MRRLSGQPMTKYAQKNPCTDCSDKVQIADLYAHN